MIKISGVLQDGQGRPIRGSLMLRSKRTTSEVIEGSYVYTETMNGQYEFELQPCEYDVFLITNSNPAQHLGSLDLYTDSPDGSLNDYLVMPSVNEVTPEILRQIQHVLETFDTSKFVKNSGDTMTGQLVLSNDGLKINYPNNNSMALRTSGDSFECSFFDSKKNQWQSKLIYNTKTNSWNYPSVTDVLINDQAVLKTGDFGIGALVGAPLSDPDERLPSGFYATKTSAFPDLSGNHSATLVVYGTNHANFRLEFLNVVVSQQPEILVRCDTPTKKTSWQRVYTTANVTVDGNGNLKSASPIVRLFSDENIAAVDGYTQAGCCLVNELADGVTAKRVQVGHYEVYNSLGFAQEGWTITLPEDANGNKKITVEYSVDENNVIIVKTYTLKFDPKLCKIVPGDPIDIPVGRWIDLRLEMPAQNSESID